MKKTKIEQRIENACDAFFTDDFSSENSRLSSTGEAHLRRGEKVSEISEKADVFLKILKQVFLFFPGTGILFIISFGLTIFAVFNPLNAKIPAGRAVYGVLWFLAAVLMTWYGIGDLRKRKHLVVPLSIIAVGILVGASSGLLASISVYFQSIVWNNSYPLYWLPLALVVPFLAKGWVDGNYRQQK